VGTELARLFCLAGNYSFLFSAQTRAGLEKLLSASVSVRKE